MITDIVLLLFLLLHIVVIIRVFNISTQGLSQCGVDKTASDFFNYFNHNLNF